MRPGQRSPGKACLLPDTMTSLHNSFNEAGAKKPRKGSNLASAEDQVMQSFNEAGAKKPRKGSARFAWLEGVLPLQ